MTAYQFTFCGVDMWALPSGALYMPAARLLCVSDLHLGKSGRRARQGGMSLPPYETDDTLTRLDQDIRSTNPGVVVCLGDSFDDDRAALELTPDQHGWILRMMAGRQWIWIAGNHDPAPLTLGGSHHQYFTVMGLAFRHIADPTEQAEISGHYHPKATLRHRGRSITRKCFLVDEARMILPAYGTYTGGLRSQDVALRTLMSDTAQAILLADPPAAIPMPRG